MANYKLITATPTSSPASFLAFTAGATNTIVTSIVASDSAASSLEALIKKNGASVIEIAHKQVQSDKPEELLTAPFSLEALDELYVRTSRVGAQFVISYVEETELTNDTAIGGLVDVDTTGVSDGDVIAYSSSAGVWQPVAQTGGSGGGASDLDGLSDVSISSSVTGDFLLHNGTNYVDQNFDSKVSTNATVFGHTTKLALVDVTQNVDLDAMESDIATNNSKTGYTTTLFSTDFNTKTTADLTEASASKYYTEARVSANADVTANTAKISYTDAAAVATNSAKISYTDAAAVTANTAKISYTDAAAVTANTAKISYTDAADVTANTTKLAGIDAGATANQTDAYLMNRVYHTGTQASSTISDFSTAVDARIGVAKIEDLDEVSSTAPSTGQVLKWSGTEWAPAADNSSSGGAGGVVDSVNGISQATVVLDTDDISEGTNKYTTAAEITKLSGIATGATANSSDGHLKARSNHSGTQAASTISDFNSQATTQANNAIAASDLQDIGNVDNPTTGEFLKWNGSTWETDTVGSSGGVVNSVNGVSQATVVLDTDDISEGTNKYTTAADITKMGHISVTQAVDLDAMESTIASNTGMAGAAAAAAVGASNAVTNHTTSIENHADVTFVYNGLNRPDGAHLVWDTDHWGEEVSALGDMADVDLTTTAPSTNDVLEWDGTNWVPTAPSGGSANVTIDANTTPSNIGDYNDGATIMNFTSVNATVAAGKPFYLGSNGWTVVSNSNATASANVIAMCTSDSTTGSSMLREGVIKVADNLTGSVGDKVYLHTGSKLITTEPTSAATVREMGVLLDATNNIIYFKPSDVSLTIQ